MDVRKFIEQLKASGATAKDAFSKALEIYARKGVEAAMKELYSDFVCPAEAPVNDVQAGIAAERKRVADIRAKGAILKVSAEVIEKAVVEGISIESATAIFVDEYVKGQAAVNPTIHVGIEAGEKFQDIAAKSLLVAAGMVKDSKVRDEVNAAGVEYAPRSLHGLFRSVLRKNGVRGVDNMTDGQLVDEVSRFRNATSQGTGDFTNILANVGNKSFAKGIEEAPTTYRVWTRQKPVKNFQQITMASLSSFSDVDLLPENSAPQHGSFSDKKELGTLRTSGKIYTISRQALVNDDLGAFTEIPRKMGIAIERAKEKECYDYIYGTSFAGPTMNEDSGALFNATAITTAGGHANLVTSGGAAPSKTTLNAGIKAIMKAPCIKGNPKDSTQYTGALPRFLIVPADLAATAWELIAANVAPLETYISGPNPFGTGGRCPLQSVVSAYLSTLTTTGWYLATDPNEIGTIAMLTLQGKSGPSFTQEENAMGAPLGLSFLIYDDWRFVAEDWRGMYCNDGD